MTASGDRNAGNVGGFLKHGSVSLVVMSRLWLLLCASLGLLGAANESPAERIRKAVRLPMVNLGVKFGFENSQDWLSEPEVADPAAEIVRLRAQLKQDLQDAVILSAIARATSQLDDDDATKAAGSAALAAWRKWAEAAPNDPKVCLGLAKELRSRLEYKEAEALLRKPSQGAAPSWEIQYELATVLGEMAIRPYYITSEPGPGPLSGGPLVKASVAEESARWMKDAMRLADALVSAEPDNPRGWSRRARLRSNRALIQLADQGRASSGPPEVMRQTFVAMMPESAIPDLEAALRLRPKDPRLLTGLLIHRLAADLINLMEVAGGGKKGPGGGFEDLSPINRAAVTQTISELDRIGEGSDHVQAASALEQSGMLNLVVRGDGAGAGERARRAIRLGSRHDEAFELAMMSVSMGGRPDWKLAEEIVRERLRVRGDGRTWLLLVKVLHEQEKAPQALEAAHDSMKALPADAALGVAHLALHIRNGSFPGPGGEGPNFDALKKQVDALPDGEAKAMLAGNYSMTAAAFIGLSGDSATARQIAEKMSQKLPQDEYVKEMSALLKLLP